MANARYSVDIAANDKTKAGVISAQNRLAKLPKSANDAGKAADRAGASFSRFSTSGLGSMVRTMGEVEKATSRAFGGSSPISAAVSKLGVIGQVTSAVGTGFGEAAAGAGILSGALGVVGVVAGATVGILGAAAFAAYKLADGWAANVAGLGRMSQTIGIATKDIQEFQQAGERAGVGKEAMSGALGGIAQTMHDARYGRNQEAAAIMARLGVKLEKGKDGQFDYTKGALDLSDAIARQKDPQTRRMLAARFGISDAALPAFAQGSKALRADMADVDRNGVINSAADVAKASRFVRDKARVGQMVDRQMNAAGGGAAGGANTAMEGILGAAQGGVGGVLAKLPAAGDAMLSGANRFAAAVDRMAGSAHGAVGDATAGLRSGAVRNFFEGKGWTREQAAGIAANLFKESHYNPGAIGDGGAAFGVGQWHADRQAAFRKFAGHDIRGSTLAEQLEFANYELTRGGERAAGMAIRGTATAADAGATASRRWERPADREGEAASRAALATQIATPIVVRNVHEFHNVPAGTTVKTKTAGSDGVAIAKAGIGSTF